MFRAVSTELQWLVPQVGTPSPTGMLRCAEVPTLCLGGELCEDRRAKLFPVEELQRWIMASESCLGVGFFLFQVYPEFLKHLHKEVDLFRHTRIFPDLLCSSSLS